MSILTIAWERAEDAAEMPQDSGLVYPDPALTIAWRPMLSSSVLDWDEPGDQPAAKNSRTAA
jgi:hypothetical protein